MKKLMVSLALLAGCSYPPEAKDCEVETITIRDGGWNVYRVIDRKTGKVLYVTIGESMKIAEREWPETKK